MTTGESISSIIAILSLIISGVTAYLTLLSRFKAKVVPKRRVILTQIMSVPYLILECEFGNEGAKPGAIEDLMLTISHPETGSEFSFAPHLTKQQFNIFEKYKVSEFGVFSAISLGAKERRELHIAFRPLLTQFSPPTGLVKVHTSVKIDGQTKWINSNSTFSLKLTEDIIEKWTSPTGEAQQIEAIEIGQSRQNLLEKKQ